MERDKPAVRQNSSDLKRQDPRLRRLGAVENISRIHNIWPPQTDSQEFIKEQKCDPEQFKGRNIFMSMFNDIVWREQGHEDKCKSNAYEVAYTTRPGKCKKRVKSNKESTQPLMRDGSAAKDTESRCRGLV